jgi:putative transposase
MSKKQRTKSEKIQLIEESNKLGALETARKHGVGYSTLMRWRQEYSAIGAKALDGLGSFSAADIKKLIRENQQLKELVAEKELRLRVTHELLKKSK